MPSSRSEICIFTSYAALAEPRAVKHATALADACPDQLVRFVDCLPYGVAPETPPILQSHRNIVHDPCLFPTRNSGLPRLIYERARHICARQTFKATGRAEPAAVSVPSQLLAKKLKAADACCFVGHNIDCLLALRRFADRGAATIFDCMEYYSEMEGLSDVQRSVIKTVERQILPRVSLVLAASDEIADAIAGDYGIERPLVLNNCPPVTELPANIKEPGFNLYWRNATLGLGGRGLEDAFLAMTKLPRDVRLHLQGRLPRDPGALYGRIGELGLADRVMVHPPFKPPEAVLAAARHSIGLCLERGVCANYRTTVSNKLFDYFMAQLAVVVSDMPSLSRVVKEASGGLVFRNGDPGDLASQIMKLYENRDMLADMAAKNRHFALREANEAREMRRFVRAFQQMMSNDEDGRTKVRQTVSTIRKANVVA